MFKFKFFKNKQKIKVKFFKNENGDIFCFEVVDHSHSIVCAAVSALVINTVNSIEEFTDDDFSLDVVDEDRICFISKSLKNNEKNRDVTLLLNSLEHGLCAIYEENKNNITIEYEEVQ